MRIGGRNFLSGKEKRAGILTDFKGFRRGPDGKFSGGTRAAAFWRGF